MATNLITDVMKLVTPALVDRIAAALGINASAVNSVLAAAVPAIFSGVTEAASTRTGLNSVMAALNHAKPDFASDLNVALSGGNAAPMMSAGTKMLSSILGAGALNNLTSAISSSTGVSATAGASLIGIAGQLAMSAFAKQAMGLDGAGVTNLLNSQKSQFGSSLGNVFGGPGAATMHPTTAPEPAPHATPPVPPVLPAARSGGTNWLMWLIPLAVIVGAAWYFLGHRDMDDKAAAPADQTAAQTQPAPAATPPATPAAIMVDNVDVTKTLGDSLTGLTGALGGITDAASAQAAVAKLQASATGIDTVSGLAAKFTPEQKSAVAALVTAALPALKDSAAKVEAMAGVGDVVKPVLDAALAKLDALTK